MSRQERTARAQKKAAQQADQIVAAATEQVAGRRRKPLPEAHTALAPKVKDMRDRGVAWWQIGFELGLPGSADNVKQGKGGAAYARKIYSASYGEIPKKQNRNGSRKDNEKNADVKALKKQRKMDRVASVRSGKAVLREDMTDEEIVETLRGRVIGWYVDLSELWGGDKEYAEQEAGVHKKFCKVETHNGERCLAFREFDPTAQVRYRGLAGAVRIVRINRIHTVR